MNIRVVGSNSSGNGYAIECGSEVLLLEAGCSLREVGRMTDLSKVVGALISHKHIDHAKYASEYVKRFRVAGPSDIKGAESIFEGKTGKMGGYSFTPFVVPHSNNDGSRCANAGYLIRHKMMGTLLFVTDTYVIPWRIRKVNHFMIEANYSDARLDHAVEIGDISRSHADRIRLSHFSLDNAMKCIEQSGLEEARSVTLIHLSDRHADMRDFKRTAMRRLGVPVYIAYKGETIRCDTI